MSCERNPSSDYMFDAYIATKYNKVEWNATNQFNA